MNRYLEISGDYIGLDVLRFYQVYRAVVRAKVALIKSRQDGDKAEKSIAEFESHLQHAEIYLDSTRPGLVITHGLSRSGKTAFSEGLVQVMGAVRVRSDVERKRLRGLDSLSRIQAAIRGGLYDPAMSDWTYERLLQLALDVIQNGYAVIVDAAFLKTTQRRMFQQAVKALGVPFVILDFVAPVEVLRARLVERERQGNDASDATMSVLDYQLRTQEPLTADEQAFTFTIATQIGREEAQRLELWRPVCERVRAS